MLNFSVKIGANGKKHLSTSLTGKTLLSLPQLNKGTAFTMQERIDFGLLGKIPAAIETLEEQVSRCYKQCVSYSDPLAMNVFLHGVHNRNQILFYKLVSEHLEELLPAIYTPTVGRAVERFSLSFRQVFRGVYMPYNEREHLETILNNRANPEVDIVCITDGEAVLGLGDQGIGGMNIPIAKLMVYSLCGGIDPNRVIPLMLDLGTNNQQLLDDPNYLGWKHHRIEGENFDTYIERVVSTIRNTLPNAFIHWEDFGTQNARNILRKYQDKICTFNDDIQGTGITALATILSAVKALGNIFTEQRIIIFGAGSAGMGIADQIVDGLVHAGLSSEQAHRCICLVDRFGLITEHSPQITDAHQPYQRMQTETANWQVADQSQISLLETVERFKPNILIGCSAQAGAFDQKVLTKMAELNKHPIILPLSNPNERAEATPLQILKFTEGKAMVATGSPFGEVEYNGDTIKIAQCNNAQAFPGIGFGVLVAQAKRLSNTMLLAAAHALADLSPAKSDVTAPLLPSINHAETTAKTIAKAICQQAVAEGLSDIELSNLDALIEQRYWKPEYLPYQKENLPF